MTKPASNEQIKLVKEIWERRIILGLDVGPQVLKALLTDENGEYLSEPELRRLNLRYKNEHRGKTTVGANANPGSEGGGGKGPSCIL